jgi:hypothetical protein
MTVHLAGSSTLYLPLSWHTVYLSCGHPSLACRFCFVGRLSNSVEADCTCIELAESLRQSSSCAADTHVQHWSSITSPTGVFCHGSSINSQSRVWDRMWGPHCNCMNRMCHVLAGGVHCLRCLPVVVWEATAVIRLQVWVGMFHARRGCNCV